LFVIFLTNPGRYLSKTNIQDLHRVMKILGLHCLFMKWKLALESVYRTETSTALLTPSTIYLSEKGLD